MLRYLTIHKEAITEHVIEKSRFIAHVKPADTREEADSYIKEIKSRHRGATHNVPAFVIGEKFELQWASDDGEPQGTSGYPILQMAVKEKLTNIVIVVTRYFGGIKLGTGGLVRAYTNSAKSAIEAAGICHVMDMDLLLVKIDYSFLDKLHNLSINGDFKICNTVYEDQVIVDLAIEPEKTEAVKGMLADLSGGRYDLIEHRKELVKI